MITVLKINSLCFKNRIFKCNKKNIYYCYNMLKYINNSDLILIKSIKPEIFWNIKITFSIFPVMQKIIRLHHTLIIFLLIIKIEFWIRILSFALTTRIFRPVRQLFKLIFIIFMFFCILSTPYHSKWDFDNYGLIFIYLHIISRNFKFFLIIIRAYRKWIFKILLWMYILTNHINFL